MNTWTVYKHIFPNGKVYIGITSLPPEERWEDGFGYQRQPRLFRQIVKMGWDNIKHEIVAEGVSEDTARFLEKTLIKKERGNSLNTQHHSGENIEWIRLPIIDDVVADRKTKFRGMSDVWLDKVRYKNVTPFDWVIEDDHIDFKYLSEVDGYAQYDTVRIPIPIGITYVGLYDYLCWKFDFDKAVVISSERIPWYNKVKEVS